MKKFITVRRFFNLLAAFFLIVGARLLDPIIGFQGLAGILCLILFVGIYFELGTFQDKIDKRVEKKIRESRDED